MTSSVSEKHLSYIYILLCEIYFRSVGLSKHNIVRLNSRKLHLIDVNYMLAKIMTIPIVVSKRAENSRSMA